MIWLRYGEIRRLVRRIGELEAELKAERERARRREDELLDRVLTAAGRHALTPEPKPRPTVEVEKPITAIEEARLAALREAAIRAGRPATDGDKVWKAQRNGQPMIIDLPDEPYLPPQ